MMDTHARKRVLVATLLDAWFAGYARYLDHPAGRSESKAWRMDRTGEWPGFRNVSRKLAEHVDGIDNSRLSSDPLWMLAGATAWGGISADTWNAAWLVCNKLRSKVGTVQEAAEAAIKPSVVMQDAPEGNAEKLTHGKGARRPTTNALLMDLLTSNHESRGWSIRQFASKTKRSIASIQGCAAWKQLEEMRAEAKATQAMDRAKRNRHRRRVRK